MPQTNPRVRNRADWSGLSTPLCPVPDTNSSFSKESASQDHQPRPSDGPHVHSVTCARPAISLRHPRHNAASRV
jgi:hypothetical protein